jgi:transcriptional regulator with XRE-family HTH domain
MEALDLRFPGMSPVRTRMLLRQLQEWSQTHGVTQRELAKKLKISYQRLNDLFNREGAEPTGEQVLQIQEIIKTKPRKKE